MQDLSEKSRKPTLIVGAGWAGLAAGIRLAKEKKPIVILEAGKSPGGRARGVSFASETLDNGQHLLLGGYQHVLAQLKFLGIEENQVLERRAFHVMMHRQRQQQRQHPFNFSFHWPKCLSLLNVLFARGLSLKERFALGYFFKHLPKISPKSLEHLTTTEIFTQFKQPHSLIHHFWNPLVHAALSTPPERAAASVFIHVMQQAFTQKSSFSDLLLPKVNLSELFPQPACDYLLHSGQKLCFREPALHLVFDHNRCVGVKTKNQLWQAENIILALPPYAALKLLPQHLAQDLPQLFQLTQQLSAFHYHPITTVYLYFKTGEIPKFKSPLLGFTQGCVQWVFDLSAIKQAPILSVVMTGKGSHSEWTQDELLKIILSEIRDYYPSLPQPWNFQVITEKRAAFCCNPGIIPKRPSADTSIPGLYLAGDYVAPGFPASLEAAVQSGITAAELLL